MTINDIIKEKRLDKFFPHRRMQMLQAPVSLLGLRDHLTVTLKDIYDALHGEGLLKGTTDITINGNGWLIANGKPLLQIATRYNNRPTYTDADAAAYWEDRILERQEAWMD